MELRGIAKLKAAGLLRSDQARAQNNHIKINEGVQNQPPRSSFFEESAVGSGKTRNRKVEELYQHYMKSTQKSRLAPPSAKTSNEQLQLTTMGSQASNQYYDSTFAITARRQNEGVTHTDQKKPVSPPRQPSPKPKSRSPPQLQVQQV